MKKKVIWMWECLARWWQRLFLPIAPALVSPCHGQWTRPFSGSNPVNFHWLRGREVLGLAMSTWLQLGSLQYILHSLRSNLFSTCAEQWLSCPCINQQIQEQQQTCLHPATPMQKSQFLTAGLLCPPQIQHSQNSWKFCHFRRKLKWVKFAFFFFCSEQASAREVFIGSWRKRHRKDHFKMNFNCFRAVSPSRWSLVALEKSQTN